MMTNNELQYKAYRFRMEVDKTTFAYGVKGVRAIWDPSLSIPGTGRRGGWRCPVGTRYGGQITDRFGRNCGWGVARRIANAITNIGDRLENVDDRRRGRRVSKRNRRMLGRLQRNAEAGRAERGLRGVAERLDGGDAETLTPSGAPVSVPDIDAPEVDVGDTETPPKRRVRNPRKPRGQLGRGWRGILDPNGRRYWERDNRGWFDGSDDEVDVAPDGDLDADVEPTRPGAGRRARGVAPEDDLGDSAEDGGREEGAEAEDTPTPTPPPRRPRRRRETIEDIFYGPDFDPPKRDGRKPNEIVVGKDGKAYKWQENPNANLIGAGRQEKGFWVPASEGDLENDRLEKKERRIKGGDLRNPKSPKGAPDPEGKNRIWTDDEGDQWEYDTNAKQWYIKGNSRKRREAEDKDREERRKMDERLRERNAQRRRDQGDGADEAQPPDKPPFDSDARDAGLRESERRRVRREIEEPGAPRTAEGEAPRDAERPRRGRRRRVEASEQRAQESASRKPAGDSVPAGAQRRPNERIDLTEEMVELDLATGESAPDERSFRNVNNRFPKNGLPNGAYWRDATYDGNDKAELERRFGRYYGGDNNINNRGKFVNQELKRRRDAGEIKPPRRKKKPAAQKPQAESVDLPPFMPGTQLDEEVRKVQKALDMAKQIAEAIDREEKDFPNLFERPWWRDTQGNGLGDDDRAKIEAALGQFYNREGRLNARGRQIFNQIAALKKNDKPSGQQQQNIPEPPIAKANSVDELIGHIGSGWRPLNTQERQIVERQYRAAERVNPLIARRDDLDIEALKNTADADRYATGQQRVIQDHIDKIEKTLKELQRGRTTRGGEVGAGRQKEHLEVIARLQVDIRRRKNLIARAEAKRNSGFAVDAPPAPANNIADITRGLADLADGKVIGEGLIPSDGLIGADGKKLTPDDMRQKWRQIVDEKNRAYKESADKTIANMTPEDIRRERNVIDRNVENWKNGYAAARELLKATVDKHEGKKLDALTPKEQQEILQLIDNVNAHAAEIYALDRVVKQFDDHLDVVGEPDVPAVASDYDGVGPMIPNEPSPPRRGLNPNQSVYNAAVKSVHEDGGSIDDVADEIIVDAMLDEELKFVGDVQYHRPGVGKITKEDLQTKGFSHFMIKGGEIENRRFNFRLIKDDGINNGVWDVIRVKDKKTGETWFLKASVYGFNGAMLEGIGMRAAEVLQLGNDRAHLRIGAPIRDARTGKEHRWMMMRGIMDWENPGGVVPQQEWQDVAKLPFDAVGRVTNISPEDAARIAVLDFVMKNNDRHHGNFMFNVDQDGKVRLGLIDHGLIGMGRGKEGAFEERNTSALTVEEWKEQVDKILRRLKRDGVDGYEGEPNNGIDGLRRLGFRHQNAAERERFGRIVARSIRVMEKQLESILSEEELQKAGMKLTPAERAHLDAVRTVAMARLEYLKKHQEDLVRKFNL
jgi:hypothetical protein